jgi:hypothetical protein
MKLAVKIASAAIGVIGVLAATAPVAADEVALPPAFRVEQDTIDLGDVVAGSEVVAVFRFHNTGASDVHIVRAKPS